MAVLSIALRSDIKYYFSELKKMRRFLIFFYLFFKFKLPIWFFWPRMLIFVLRDIIWFSRDRKIKFFRPKWRPLKTPKSGFRAEILTFGGHFWPKNENFENPRTAQHVHNPIMSLQTKWGGVAGVHWRHVRPEILPFRAIFIIKSFRKFWQLFSA